MLCGSYLFTGSIQVFTAIGKNIIIMVLRATRRYSHCQLRASSDRTRLICCLKWAPEDLCLDNNLDVLPSLRGNKGSRSCSKIKATPKIKWWWWWWGLQMPSYTTANEYPTAECYDLKVFINFTSSVLLLSRSLSATTQLCQVHMPFPYCKQIHN